MNKELLEKKMRDAIEELKNAPQEIEKKADEYETRCKDGKYPYMTGAMIATMEYIRTILECDNEENIRRGFYL